MTFNYSLEESSYTWPNTLLWGVCIDHFKKAAQGSLGDKAVHVIIALIEVLPIIGQIASIFEKIIVDYYKGYAQSANPELPPESIKINQPNGPTLPLPSILVNTTSPPNINPPTDQEKDNRTIDSLVSPSLTKPTETKSSLNTNSEIPLNSIDYQTFKKSRKPQTLPSYNEYYPENKSTKRKESFSQLEKSGSETQDPNVTIRKDARPSKDETIPNYLIRVFEEYTSEDAFPRGFVFAGCDFMHSTPGKHPAVNFLENQIDTLKKIGIKKIYLEQLYGYDDYSTDCTKDKTYLLYQYFHQGKDELPFKNINFITICKLAKNAGIEVVGAEIEGPITTIGSSNDRRLQNFNSGASALIKTINEPSVVFVGAAHGKLRRSCNPGLSDYLDCPCIGLGTSELKTHVKPGTHQFIGGHYSVDAIFS